MGAVGYESSGVGWEGAEGEGGRERCEAEVVRGREVRVRTGALEVGGEEEAVREEVVQRPGWEGEGEGWGDGRSGSAQ